MVLKYKELQTKIAMITEDKVTEIFCMADDFCNFFAKPILLHRKRERLATRVINDHEPTTVGLLYYNDL